MSDSYVCSNAKIKCSCGDKISTLTVFPDRTIWLTGEPQANISDHISMRNIAPFGKCHTTRYPATASATATNHGKLTPMPCVPNTPFPWMGGKNDVLLQNQPALLRSSSCKCVWGGTITFTYDGQIDGTYTELPKEQPQTQEELDEEATIELSAEDMLDGLQMALDAAGMFPGLGAVPDLLNACISACRGDWANAGLCLFAAIPGIGDAAGAAKLVKNGAKMAKKTKKANKFGEMESLSESLAKGPNKELAAARAKKMGYTQNEFNFSMYLDSAPTHPQQEITIGDLTRRDRFEIEEAHAIKYIHKSEESGTLLPGMLKDIDTSSGSSIQDVAKTKTIDTGVGESLQKGGYDISNKVSNYKVKPDVYTKKENPVLGKNLDIES